MSRTFRMKLVINTVARNVDHEGNTQSADITMSAVYSDKEGAANKEWCKWTPSANLKFNVTNPAVFEKLLPGQFFYADFIATDKDSL